MLRALNWFRSIDFGGVWSALSELFEVLDLPAEGCSDGGAHCHVVGRKIGSGMLRSDGRDDG